MIHKLTGSQWQARADAILKNVQPGDTIEVDSEAKRLYLHTQLTHRGVHAAIPVTVQPSLTRIQGGNPLDDPRGMAERIFARVTGETPKDNKKKDDKEADDA